MSAPTTTGSFDIQLNPEPAPSQRREQILAAPGFGKFFTDHMVTIAYRTGEGWCDAKLQPFGPLSVSPAMSALHYGQEIFEGLKAYRQPDGSIATFRPDANAARFARSAARLAMPALPEDLFLSSLRVLLEHDAAWVPAAGGEDSLYLRPFMVATDAFLGVRPAQQYLYCLIASPAGGYFADGISPVSVWLSTEFTRAAPGGTGEAKCAGNYAASLVAQAQASAQGCDQVVWLDAVEHRYIEEMGGMNLFFVIDEGDMPTLVTPLLSGSLLPGITRDSLILMAADRGYAVADRRISTDELEQAAQAGRLREMFACGTAAVITPVGTVKGEDVEFTVADGRPGELTMALRRDLLAIQQGTGEDTHGWRHTLVAAS